MGLGWFRHIPGLRTAGINACRLWWVLTRRELFPPGHYYSPTPDERWIHQHRDRLFAQTLGHDDGIDLREEEQRELLLELAEFHAEFDVSDDPRPDRRYYAKNDFFDRPSAFNLFSMFRRFRPRRVVEVGSGFSSAIMLDTDERFHDRSTSFTFVEPHPARLHRLLRKEDRARCRILAQPVQEVDFSAFTELEADDFLFIDSSHVTKIGSDLNHLMFEVLPRLRPGVLVHFHDMTWPFEYPERWLMEGRFWNEAYLLRAFLQFNDAWEIALFDDFLVHRFPELFQERLPEFARCAGRSLWLRRRPRPLRLSAAA